MNCLDSSFVVDFLDSEQRHHEQAVEWMESHAEEELAVPAICAFEVLRATTRAGDDRFDSAVGFPRTLTVLNLTPESAIAAGELGGQLHGEGTPLGVRDTLVA